MALDQLAISQDVHAQLREELLAGLLAEPRSINPKFFYDQRGSELFSKICEVDEYYPTRTEIGILESCSKEIAAAVGEHAVLLEPGAGACEKVQYLLQDLKPDAYLPLDISRDFLLESAERLREHFPALNVVPLVADFNEDFALPDVSDEAHRVVFYPGSTIGNFTPKAARGFLERAAELLGPLGGLLIGVDLHKSSEILNAAYNDADGYTEAFNLNVLEHANRLLDADFYLENFAHVAFYNRDAQRIEMHLECRIDHEVQCGDKSLSFTKGERIHTEYSHKYTVSSFAALAETAGFEARSCWTDSAGLFSVQYFEVAGDSPSA